MNLLENAVKADIMVSGGDFDKLHNQCYILSQTYDNAAKMYGILGMYTGNIEANIKLPLIDMLYSTGHIDYWMDAISKKKGLLDRFVNNLRIRANGSMEERLVEAGSNIVLQTAVEYFTNYRAHRSYHEKGCGITFDDCSEKFIYSDIGYKVKDYKYLYLIEQDEEVILIKRWYNPYSAEDRECMIKERLEGNGKLIIERR